MAWTEAPPFFRGNTFMNGSTIDTVNDPTPGEQFEGKEYIFPDTVYGTGVPVKVRCVRNGSLLPVLPGLLYAFDPAYNRRRVLTATTVTSQKNVFPADELLPAAGAPVNDLFYLVISGPALIYTEATAGAGNVFAQGDQVIAVTAATSGAPDAGHIAVGATVGSTANSNGYVGYAMSAATTGNTASGLLVMVESRW